MLWIDPIGSRPLVGLERLDRVSGPLHGARHEPANGMLLMPMSA